MEKKSKFKVTRKQSVIVEAEDPDAAVHRAYHDIDQSKWHPNSPYGDLEKVELIDEEAE